MRIILPIIAALWFAMIDKDTYRFSFGKLDVITICRYNIYRNIQ